MKNTAPDVSGAVFFHFSLFMSWPSLSRTFMISLYSFYGALRNRSASMTAISS